MKKRYMILILILILSLSSCNFDFTSFFSHEHEYIKSYDENSHYDYCECGKKINEVSHNFTEWTVITEATISQDGLRQKNCKECDYILSEIIDKIPHEHQFSTDYIADVDYHYYECECKERKNQAPHTFTDWEIINNPTTTENGKKERYCSICEYTQTEIIPKTTHVCIFKEDYKYTELNHYKECECGNKIYEEHDHTYKNEIYIENSIQYLKSECKCGHQLKNELNQRITNNYGYKKFKELNEKYALFYVDLYSSLSNFTNSKINVVKNNDYYEIASVNYKKYSISIDEAMAVWSIIYLENPQFYFMSNEFTYTEEHLNVCIDEDYINFETRQAIQADINQMLVECSNIIKDTDNEITKAYKIHNFLIDRIDYAYENDGITPQDDAWAHNIVGMAQKKGGVCESYSKSYKYLCNIFGIENILVTGYSKSQSHAWNMINIDNEWYHVDLTWNDQKNTIYNYFALSKADIEKDHEIKICDTLKINYLYELPQQAASTIQLVTLYENNDEVGLYKSIDDAFSMMVNVNSSYKIRLHLFKYNSADNKLYAISNYKYNIKSKFPQCNRIEISALDSSIAEKYDAITELNLNTDNILNSNLTLINICLKTNNYNFNLSNYNITLKGYSGGISGIYTSNTGIIIKQTIK